MTKLGNNFRKVKYTTLSPLHIGDGNTLGPLEYFVHQGRIYFYKSEDLNRILTKNQMEDFINYAITEESPNLFDFFKTYKDTDTEKILEWASKKTPYSLGFLGSGTPERVWSFIKSRNKPYIPGSEIKGAIRTAVVRKLLSYEDEIDKFRSSISRYDARSKEEFSTRTLRIPQQRGDRTIWDAKFDFMKFLFVLDADIGEVKPFVAKVENKNTSKSGDYHEIIPERTEFQGEVQIANGNQFHTFVEKYRADGLRKSLFTGLAQILEACYDMTNAILDEESAFFSKSKTFSVQKQLEDIKKQNTKNSPVIRIGKHQGFMSLTLATLVKKLGDGVFRKYAESLSLRNRTIHPNNFPKTRKVLVNPATKEELSLGWVKIEVE